MQSFSVIIVGAGPGGLACAKLLAEHGIDVLVLEKKPVAGPKVCGGGITWAGLIKRVPEHLIEHVFLKQYIRSNYQQTVIKAEDPIVVRPKKQGRKLKPPARSIQLLLLQSKPAKGHSDTVI
jgi:geranylgeranyl reductase